jgi:hypothetical protein
VCSFQPGRWADSGPCRVHVTIARSKIREIGFDSLETRRPVARALCFSDQIEECNIGTHVLASPEFSASPVTPVRKTRGRKKVSTPVSDIGLHRCTRSSSKLDGHRPTPVCDNPRPRKKAKAKATKRNTQPKGQTSPPRGEEHQTLTPEIPVETLQKIGQSLGIDTSKLTKEKLTADPVTDSSNSPSNDK